MVKSSWIEVPPFIENFVEVIKMNGTIIQQMENYEYIKKCQKWIKNMTQTNQKVINKNMLDIMQVGVTGLPGYLGHAFSKLPQSHPGKIW